MSAPALVKTKAAYRLLLAGWQKEGRSIGFVPTMGALHQGHVSLAQIARNECDIVVSSIFINPTQFGPNEDYHKYPKTLEMDMDLLARSVKGRSPSSPGVDVVYAPDVDDLYPGGFPAMREGEPPQGTFVSVHGLSHQMEGAIRPTHFRGVATVVTKLLNLVSPTHLYLGQKDIQQCVVLKNMIRDLCWDISVRICPILRESDGLAMSSRNRYLSQHQRQIAPLFYQGLSDIQRRIKSKQSLSKADMIKLISTNLPAQHDEARGFPVVLEYVSLADPYTLQELESNISIGHFDTAILSGALKIGTTRIIDNVLLGDLSLHEFSYTRTACT